MHNPKDFLARLQQELNEGGNRDELLKRAWAWFDSTHLQPEEEHEVRRAIIQMFGVKEDAEVPAPRFTNLLSRSLYPTSGWLSDYLEYTTFCGAPLPFHFYAGATVLGAALKRNAWMPFGRNNVYCSMYVVLVAPPGVCYKSTCIGIAVGLLRETELVTVIGGRATPEGLSDILSTTEGEEPKDAIAIIAASELYRFLAGHNTPANNQIVAALTSWYDALDEDDDITVTRKKRKLHNIAISLLGGTTLDWLVESLPKTVFAGGFMSRLVFVNQESTDRIMSLSPPDDPVKRMRLVEDMLDIHDNFKGPIEMSKQAFKLYDEWFIQQHHFLVRSEERVADFYQRRADYVRKMSLILAASHGHTKVELSDLEWSIKLLEMLNPALDAVITPISLGESGHDLDVVRRTVERHGTISRTTLVRRCSARGIDAEKMSKLVETLKQAGLVKQDKRGEKGGRVYVWVGR